MQPNRRFERRAKRPKARIDLTGAPAGMAIAGGGDLPTLTLREPEDPRRSIISGSIATALHLGALGVLLLFVWMAPDVVEELIPVKIIRELPGAVDPAPAPKILKPRKARRPVTQARRVTAQPVAQPRVAPVTARPVQVNQIQRAQAPSQVQRRQVVSRRTEARRVVTGPVVTRVDQSKLQPVDVVSPTEVAPIQDYDGPTEVAPSAGPAEYQELAEVEPSEYDSAAPVTVVVDEEWFDEGAEPFELDTDVGVYAGGEGTGGTGTQVGTVECMSSGFVVRYLDGVKARTRQRWQLPADTPTGAKVQLRFALDASGTATRVEYKGDVDPALGNSAVQALRSASPFPPMDDNVRCLAGRGLVATFDTTSL